MRTLQSSTAGTSISLKASPFTLLHSFARRRERGATFRSLSISATKPAVSVGQASTAEDDDISSPETPVAPLWQTAFSKCASRFTLLGLTVSALGPALGLGTSFETADTIAHRGRRFRKGIRWIGSDLRRQGARHSHSGRRRPRVWAFLGGAPAEHPCVKICHRIRAISAYLSRTHCRVFAARFASRRLRRFPR